MFSVGRERVHLQGNWKGVLKWVNAASQVFKSNSLSFKIFIEISPAGALFEVNIPITCALTVNNIPVVWS